MATVTKAAVRQWMKRVREDMRDIEAAMKRDDWEAVQGYANDAVGSAGEIETMAQVAQGEVDVTGSYSAQPRRRSFASSEQQQNEGWGV